MGYFDVLPRNAQGRSGDGRHASGSWGKFGAAGLLLAHTDTKGVTRYLLCQRGKLMSSYNGFWQLPGGALHEFETPSQGAARELTEELSAAREYVAHIQPVGEHTYTHKSGWTYTNLAASVSEPFTPVLTDPFECPAAGWFTAEEIAGMDLLPVLANALPDILALYPAVASEGIVRRCARKVAARLYAVARFWS